MITFTQNTGPNVIHIMTREGTRLIMPAMSLTDDARPQLDLCVHKGVEWYTPWTVSERSSGFSIAHGETSEDAISLASAALATKTDEEIAQRIAAALALVAA